MVDSPEIIDKDPLSRCPYMDVCSYGDYGSDEMCTSCDYDLCVWYETMKEIYDSYDGIKDMRLTKRYADTRQQY